MKVSEKTEKREVNRLALEQGADCLLLTCGTLKKNERFSIICDTDTKDVADVIAERARRISSHVQVIQIPPLSMHGQEPPQFAVRHMQQSDLCLGITKKSMAHTKARLEAAKTGCRYLSLPDYSLGLLCDPSLLVDYHARSEIARRFANAFTNGTKAEVTTTAGTCIRLNLRGRVGNCCPGIVTNPGDLGSPPDIEANISPIETDSEGIVIVDGSIPFPGFGLLKESIELEIRGGKIIRMSGNSKLVEKLKALFQAVQSDKALILAECGVGLNNKAVLSGVMLIDEGAFGTMHFGFGSNATVGGVNDVPFHLDFVFQKPTLSVDDKCLLLRGELL